MKIIKLTAENFMRLVAIEIKPDGNTIVLTGKNGAGKSSVLDAIVGALCGANALPQKPIRKGQKSARVEIQTEDFNIKRTFSDGKSSLVITNGKGFKVKSPQALLDRVVGKIAFDPMSFCKEEPREQRRLLMDLLGINFDDIDEQYVKCQTERAQINANKTLMQQRLAGLVVPEGTPDEEVSVSELANKVREAMQHNEGITSAKHNLDLIYRQHDEVIEALQEINVELDALATKKNELITRNAELTKQEMDGGEFLKKARKKFYEMKPVDIEPIQAQITAAEITNRNVHIRHNRLELEEAIKAKATKYVELGREMKDLEKDKATRLSKVKMPLDNISVTEDSVTFEGIPLAQVNDAKKLEIGVAISIALNPKLRVLRMKGNDLDSNSLANISKMVADKDYQAWIEKVSEDEKVGVFIEDGMIKEKET